VATLLPQKKGWNREVDHPITTEERREQGGGPPNHHRRREQEGRPPQKYHGENKGRNKWGGGPPKHTREKRIKPFRYPAQTTLKLKSKEIFLFL